MYGSTTTESPPLILPVTRFPNHDNLNHQSSSLRSESSSRTHHERPKVLRRSRGAEAANETTRRCGSIIHHSSSVSTQPANDEQREHQTRAAQEKSKQVPCGAISGTKYSIKAGLASLCRAARGNQRPAAKMSVIITVPPPHVFRRHQHMISHVNPYTRDEVFPRVTAGIPREESIRVQRSNVGTA